MLPKSPRHLYKNCHRPLVGTALLAALLAAITAWQGPNHDAMIFYQAGLRSWGGQLPYRDFTVPQGPVAGIVFAFFLWLVPFSGGWAFLVASAALNALATVLVWSFLREVTGDRRNADFGALLTALWFLTVFGSYYNDHLAYVLVLGAALARVRERWALAGVLLAAAYHTKQTVGSTGLAAILICEIVAYRGRYFRQWVTLTTSLLATHALVLGAIALTGGWSAYWRSVVLAPLQFAARRPDKNPLRLVTFLLLPWEVQPWRMLREHGWGRIVFYPLVLTAYAAALALYRRKLTPKAAYGLGLLWLSTLWCACWLGRFQGQLVFGAGGAAALTASAWGWRARWAVPAFALLALVNVAAGGVFHRGFEARLWQTDLWPLRLPADERSRMTADVFDFLKDKPGAIAVAGGETYYVAAALRRAPWNPSVYFEFPLTVPLDSELMKAWEDDFVTALEKNDVRYVIADVTWEHKDYAARLKEYVLEKYSPLYRSGTLLVLGRK